jgi:hypothetical protein
MELYPLRPRRTTRAVARAQSHWRLKVVATAAPATARLPIRELGGMAPRDTKGSQGIHKASRDSKGNHHPRSSNWIVMQLMIQVDDTA